MKKEKLKIGDRVRIVRRYCGDSMYVGLEGIVINIVEALMHTEFRIKVELPEDDQKRYYMGDEVLFPAECLVKKIIELRDTGEEPSLDDVREKLNEVIQVVNSLKYVE